MSCPKKNLSPPDHKSDLVSLMVFKQFNKDSTKIKVRLDFCFLASPYMTKNIVPCSHTKILFRIMGVP